MPGAPPADAAEPGDAAKPDSGNASPDTKPNADGDADAAASDDTKKSPAATPRRKTRAMVERMNALREQLERDQTYLDALQTRVDSLTADFVNRDDPAQRSQIANDRQKALGEIDRLKKAIEQDKAAIPELEEEARRAGVPAGWLR